MRVRIQLLRGLRDQGRLTAVQGVVQRASRLADKGDLPLDVLSSTEVVDPSRFESASEKGLFDATKRLNPLAESGAYQELCDVLVESTPALEAFFDGDESVMVMADDSALRMNRLNLLGVLRNQAAVFAQFELIQS